MEIIFLIIGVSLIFFIAGLISNYSSSKPTQTYTYYEEPEYTIRSTTSKPKISAEISESLSTEVRSYCNRNSMSTSELIRRAVREYMDNH